MPFRDDPEPRNFKKINGLVAVILLHYIILPDLLIHSYQRITIKDDPERDSKGGFFEAINKLN